MKLSRLQVLEFQTLVYDFFQKHGRDLPWRALSDPYLILVSEVMSQQTQINRVVPKWLTWKDRFPTIDDLAHASWAEVMRVWSGLGYYRRAKKLHELSQVVLNEYGGELPATYKQLVTLPGIGDYTASAVLAFAHNQACVVIDTNVRTVMVHHFMPEAEQIGDEVLRPLVEQTMDRNNPRKWYSAVLDYGADIKLRVGNLNKQSKHYAKQSRFEGSDRQLRAMILKLLIKQSYSIEELLQCTDHPPIKLKVILQALAKEKLVYCRNNQYSLR